MDTMFYSVIKNKEITELTKHATCNHYIKQRKLDSEREISC